MKKLLFLFLIAFTMSSQAYDPLVREMMFDKAEMKKHLLEGFKELAEIGEGSDESTFTGKVNKCYKEGFFEQEFDRVYDEVNPEKYETLSKFSDKVTEQLTQECMTKKQ